MAPVPRVDPAWRMNTALGSPWASSVSVPASMSAAPADMPEGRVERVLDLLLTDLLGERTPDRRLRETAALLACHSAVRFGDTMTPESARQLLSLLAVTEDPISCPHGRPTTLILPDDQLRRLFKRP